MLSKEFLGILSVVLTLVGYASYFWSILKQKTKPHMFSWLVGGIVNGIAFFGQYSRGAGAGSWTTGATALICFVIFGLSTVWGEWNITRSDWAAFIGALAAIPLWYFTSDPLGAIILAILIDAMGLYPTLRKSYSKPYEEDLFAWAITTFRSLISLFALERYSLVTVIFPLAMAVLNGAVAFMLVWRRPFYKKPNLEAGTP